MSKRTRQQKQVQQQQPRRGMDPLALSTLIAVGIVLVVSVLNLQAAKRIQADFEGKLRRLEDRIAKISTPPAQPARTTPQRRGPDPDRVYPIKTAGRPSKGPATAPIVIAEFSDFQ